MTRRRCRAGRGQAAVEVLALVPLLVVVALLGWQLAAVVTAALRADEQVRRDALGAERRGPGRGGGRRGAGPGVPARRRRPARARPRRRAHPVRRGQDGQALPLVLVTAALVMAGAVALFALGRAHVAVVRAQTVADVAAVSAARELRARLGEVAADPAGPASAPAWRRRLTAVADAAARPAGARVESLAFPDGAAWPPTAVQVEVSVAAPRGMRARAAARAGLLASASMPAGATGWASGGGYRGPLVYRDGKPMCPAVAAAFDLMDAAAHADGVDLLVTSGFRSDAEQAVLFRRHPDPTWVAPPGRSRHRDATELDLNMLGGDGAHAWLRSNGGRFGFVQRYSWEPWHWGYVPGCGGGGAAPARRRLGAARLGPGAVPRAHPSAALGHGLQPVLLAALLRSSRASIPGRSAPPGPRGSRS